MSTASPEPEPVANPRAVALLWDLDNVSPPREHVASLAEALCRLVPSDSPLIAAGHRVVFRSSRPLLAALGFEVLSGGRRADGADRVLMQQARLLHEQGVTRFLVASNDHRFAGIARFADLDVLTLSDAYVSARLRAAAGTVTVLAFVANAIEDPSGVICVPRKQRTGDHARTGLPPGVGPPETAAA
jgi:hypothetical protein